MLKKKISVLFFTATFYFVLFRIYLTIKITVFVHLFSDMVLILSLVDYGTALRQFEKRSSVNLPPLFLNYFHTFFPIFTSRVYVTLALPEKKTNIHTNIFNYQTSLPP